MQVCETGALVLNLRYAKGVPLLSNWYKNDKGLDLGAKSLRLELCTVPLPTGMLMSVRLCDVGQL